MSWHTVRDQGREDRKWLESSQNQRACVPSEVVDRIWTGEEDHILGKGRMWQIFGGGSDHNRCGRKASGEWPLPQTAVVVGRGRNLPVGEKCRESWLTKYRPDRLFSFDQNYFKRPDVNCMLHLEKIFPLVVGFWMECLVVMLSKYPRARMRKEKMLTFVIISFFIVYFC